MCYDSVMTAEFSIFHLSPEAEVIADAEGMADVVAGRVVPHELVAAWLDTWGRPEEKPPSWLERKLSDC